jgi:hypothetical protein
MTEAEWLASDDPREMRRVLFGKMSDRKERLFACACCREVWAQLADYRSREAIIVAERFADGSATEEELDAASEAAAAAEDADRRRMGLQRENPTEQNHGWPLSAAAYNAAIPLGWWGGASAFVAPYEIVLDASTDIQADRTAQCRLLRDIFGNPFRPVAFDPRWRTEDVLGLARGIYEDRAFDRLPLLADALMDAGCDSDDILSHCRGEGPHVRGCWVVDLVLGKE